MEALVLPSLLLLLQLAPPSVEASWPPKVPAGLAGSTGSSRQDVAGRFHGASRAELRGAHDADTRVSEDDLVEVQQETDQTSDFVLFTTCWATSRDLENECAQVFPLYCFALSAVVTGIITAIHFTQRWWKDRKRKKRIQKAEKKAETDAVAKCPWGHPLTRYKAPGGVHICDLRGEKTQFMYGCRIDKWGVCARCHKLLLADALVEINAGVCPPVRGATSSTAGSRSGSFLVVPVAPILTKLSGRSSEKLKVTPNSSGRGVDLEHADSNRSSRKASAQQEAPATLGLDASAVAAAAQVQKEVAASIPVDAESRKPKSGFATSKVIHAPSSAPQHVGRTAAEGDPPPSGEKEAGEDGTLKSGMSNVSDVSMMSDVSDFSQVSEYFDGDAPPRPAVNPRWRAAGRRKDKKKATTYEEVYIEFELTQEEVVAVGEELEAFFEEKIRARADELGLTPEQYRHDAMQLLLTDSKGDTHTSWDDLEVKCLEDPDLFPVQFKYTAKRKKNANSADRLDKGRDKSGGRKASPRPGRTKRPMWNR